MPQSSGPISQGTVTERQMTDVLWRDLFGDEAGVVGDLDGTAYRVTLPPTDSNVVQVGSTTQRSMARVAGFIHTIPAGETEPVTIPAASGSDRTDILALRYDPANIGAPGPVRLVRIEGTSSGLPVYDAAAPGVEDLPLWSITRKPGQALSQAAVTRLFPRIAPGLDIPVGAPLPLSSPLGTMISQGNTTFRRELDGSQVPVWVRMGRSEVYGGALSGPWVVPVEDNQPRALGTLTVNDPGFPYRLRTYGGAEVYPAGGARVDSWMDIDNIKWDFKPGWTNWHTASDLSPVFTGTRTLRWLAYRANGIGSWTSASVNFYMRAEVVPV